MKEVTVYLSGGFHSDWQEKVMKACEGYPIRFLNPLEKEVGADGKWKNIHLTEAEKEAKSKNEKHYFWFCDKKAVKIADIIFVNCERYGFEEGKIRGTGDIFEMGMAFALDKLVIYVNQVDHRYYNHFQPLFASFKTLDEGIAHLIEKCSWLHT